MKINNKGMTLIELLVSIVLIGIVLVFLFQLLVDLKNETENNNFAYNNQVNRTEAIYTIQNDLSNPEYTLIAIQDDSTDDKFSIKFVYEGAYNLPKPILEIEKVTTENELLGNMEKYYLKYTSIDGTKYSWEMKGATVDQCGLFTYKIDETANKYYFKLNLYLYNSVYHDRNNKDRNNAVDDIELTHTGNLNDIEFSGLTNTESGYKKIGICAN